MNDSSCLVVSGNLTNNPQMVSFVSFVSFHEIDCNLLYIMLFI